MYFMRAPANPEGIHCFDISSFHGGPELGHIPYLHTDEDILIIQTGYPHIIKSEQLKDPAYQKELQDVIRQEFSWWSYARGKQRRKLTYNYPWKNSPEYRKWYNL